MVNVLLLCCVLILVLLLIGVPVSYAFLAGSLFYLVISGSSTGAVASTAFNALNSYTYLAVPLFVLVGRLMVTSTIATKLVNWAAVLLRKVKGGMAAAIIVAAAFFGMLSGSNIATANAVGSIMFPPMEKMGWDRRYIGAVLAAAAPLGFLIPPNTHAIMYAVIANASVSGLFLSTIVPAAIWAVLMLIINRLMYKKWYHPEKADPEYQKNGMFSAEGGGRSYIRDVGSSTVKAIPALIMPLIILGGIYGGIFTATEAGAVACLYALLVGLLLYRTLKLRNTVDTFAQTAKDMGVILFITTTAAVFSRILLINGVPQLIADSLLQITSSRVAILLIIDLIYLVAGCFLSPPVIIYVVTPLLMPTASAMGIDAIQLGVILFVAIGIGNITPPYASNLFISARMAKAPVSEIIPPVMPYLLFVGIPVLLLTTFVPVVSTWLPSLFKG